MFPTNDQQSIPDRGQVGSYINPVTLQPELLPQVIKQVICLLSFVHHKDLVLNNSEVLPGSQEEAC